MIWPIERNGARLLRITPDEAAGELFIRAVFDDGMVREIVYDGMFYSQLDETNQGLIITAAAEISLKELEQPEHREAVALLYGDCGVDDAFLRDMYRRGNHLYAHRTGDSGEYLVLAKRLAFGETRLYNADNAEKTKWE